MRIFPFILGLGLLSFSAGSRAGKAVPATRVVRAEPEMVFVPGGAFGMGMTKQEFERVIKECRIVSDTRNAGMFANCKPGGMSLLGPPARLFIESARAGAGAQRRRVFVSDFFIDRHETTAQKYRECVRAGACSPSAISAGDERYFRDEWPVVNVTWSEARNYCRWRRKKLPTEAQWEKAARGNDGRRWPWGGGYHSRRANLGRMTPLIERSFADVRGRFVLLPTHSTDASDGADTLVPPGRFVFDRSPYGAYDMAGNVAEWVRDSFAPQYDDLATVNPMRRLPTMAAKVVRGGSFIDPPFRSRTYSRNAASARTRASWIGFRCARDVGRKP